MTVTVTRTKLARTKTVRCTNYAFCHASVAVPVGQRRLPYCAACESLPTCQSCKLPAFPHDAYCVGCRAIAKQIAANDAETLGDCIEQSTDSICEYEQEPDRERAYAAAITRALAHTTLSTDYNALCRVLDTIKRMH